MADRKTEVLRYRLSSVELQLIRQAADAADESVSRFARKAALAAGRVFTVGPDTRSVEMAKGAE